MCTGCGAPMSLCDSNIHKVSLATEKLYSDFLEGKYWTCEALAGRVECGVLNSMSSESCSHCSHPRPAAAFDYIKKSSIYSLPSMVQCQCDFSMNNNGKVKDDELEIKSTIDILTNSEQKICSEPETATKKQRLGENCR